MKICNIAAAFALTTSLAIAQTATWPEKPVKIVVPTSAGSAGDLVSRVLAEHLSRLWAQPVIVENKPGANGIIGTSFMINSKPDGYTISITSPISAQNIAFARKLPYDQAKDTVRVTQINQQQYALVAPATLNGDHIKTIIENAKKAGKLVNFATVGVGSSGHLVLEKLKFDTGMNIVNVAYKGSAELMTAITGGEVDLGIVDMQAASTFFKGGKIKYIAVMGPKRVANLPNVPTLLEEGVDGFNTYTWNGYLAPAGTPQNILKIIADGINKVQAIPEVRKKMIETLMVEPVESSPEKFAKLFNDEVEAWTQLNKKLNLKLDQ